MKTISHSSTTSSRDHRPVDADGLIRVSTDAVTSGARFFVACIVAGVFLLSLFSTGVIDLIWPMPKLKLAGQEKVREEKRIRNARIVDGTAARLLEHNLRQQSRVREWVTPEYTFALYNWLGAVKKSVLLGKDGWLYHRRRVFPRNESNEEIAGWGGALFSALHRRLTERGIRLVMVPIPRKAVTCREFLPDDVNARLELDSLLVEEIRRRGVDCVDLVTPFLKDTGEPLYHKLDTHWTDRAQLVAAEAICQQAGLFVPEDKRRTKVLTSATVQQSADLLRFIGLNVLGRIGKHFDHLTAERMDVFNLKGSKIPTQNPDEMTRLAIVGTSFSARRRLPQFLTHFTQERTWNGADRGTGFVTPLLRFLRKHLPEKPPEVLFLEAPMFLVYIHKALPSFGELFTVLEPPQLSVVLGGEEISIVPRFKKETPLSRRLQKVANLPFGKAGQSGDGIAALRIRGSVKGGAAELELFCGSGKLKAPWKPGQGELIIPLLSAGPSNFAVLFARRGAEGEKGAKLKITSIDVVTDLDLSRGSAGMAEKVLPNSGEWQQMVIFPEPEPIPERAALEVKLDVVGPFRKELEIEILFEDINEEPVRTKFTRMRRQGIVLLSLGGVAGEKIKSIRVKGAGALPKSVVQSAAIRRPFE